MKHVHFDRIISLCIWGIGTGLVLVLLMSGETIFILPTFFSTIALTYLITSLKKHVPLLRISRFLVWYICFSLFSYLSAESAQTKPFFPLLCITFVLSMLLQLPKFPKAYNNLFTSTWISCIAVVFYFGLWPIGLIAIGISWLITVILSIKQKQAMRSDQQVKQPEQEAIKQDNVTNEFQPTFQVPGQQYQPSLPEYNESFGPYIQDLPSDK
jgi:hypothetical protein